MQLLVDIFVEFHSIIKFYINNIKSSKNNDPIGHIYSK